MRHGRRDLFAARSLRCPYMRLRVVWAYSGWSGASASGLCGLCYIIPQNFWTDDGMRGITAVRGHNRNAPSGNGGAANGAGKSPLVPAVADLIYSTGPALTDSRRPAKRDTLGRRDVRPNLTFAVDGAGYDVTGDAGGFPRPPMPSAEGVWRYHTDRTALFANRCPSPRLPGALCPASVDPVASPVAGVRIPYGAGDPFPWRIRRPRRASPGTPAPPARPGYPPPRRVACPPQVPPGGAAWPGVHRVPL